LIALRRSEQGDIGLLGEVFVSGMPSRPVKKWEYEIRDGLSFFLKLGLESGLA